MYRWRVVGLLEGFDEAWKGNEAERKEARRLIDVWGEERMKAGRLLGIGGEEVSWLRRLKRGIKREFQWRRQLSWSLKWRLKRRSRINSLIAGTPSHQSGVQDTSTPVVADLRRCLERNPVATINRTDQRLSAKRIKLDDLATSHFRAFPHRCASLLADPLQGAYNSTSSPKRFLPCHEKIS
ncbi:uncharacterized protein CC84DRAFT_267983 [Paraphaeosphaeria sporulosa]|uniref:Uncharacterized protein n=1 Tax=Paraphaeosphaeria sporulosa TaxID=1460663 RepID=A0A177C1Z1_9PLEO|nr:uncharacterized protein CC84DRAFT_267983 [Paraphaeosphaeria sporulosa]OAG00862.1 hypothetical protein CC84DRAFT_267983 [Paraphaeosphaeria sporulosa]